MQKKLHDFGALGFIALLHEVGRMASPRVIVDWLNNVGAYFAQRLSREERYESFEELESALKEGRTSYAKMDGSPSIVEGGLVGTPTCPFYYTMFTWRETIGNFPQEWRDAVEEYERRGEVANSPACIFHNNYRRFCTQRIFVAEKPCSFQFIACKSPLSGEIRFNEKAIKNLKANRRKLNHIMKENACVYHIKVEEEN